MIEIEEIKKSLRNEIRKRIGAVNRTVESAAIMAGIESLLPAEGPILGFTPLPDEPDIAPLLEQLKAEGRLVVIAPHPGARLELPDRPLALALVPGRAFDRAGTRLGRGGGAYDRLLAGIAAPKIGVAFACQLSVEELPRAAHDVPMDVIVTSEEIVRVGAD